MASRTRLATRGFGAFASTGRGLHCSSHCYRTYQIKDVHKRRHGHGHGRVKPEQEKPVPLSHEENYVVGGILKRINERRNRIKEIAALSALYGTSSYKNDVATKYGEPITKDPISGVDVGDFLAISSFSGVVVKIVILGMAKMALILTPLRDLRLASPTNPDFVIKSFVPKEVAMSAVVSASISAADQMLRGMGILDNSLAPPADPDMVNMLLSPPYISNYVCEPLRSFEFEAMAIRSRLLPLMSDVHKSLMSESECKIYTLIDFGDYIINKYGHDIVGTSVMNTFYYALDSVLSGDKLRWIRPTKGKFQKLRYAAISSSTVSRLAQGMEYMRHRDDDTMRNFVLKSRKLISYYRSMVSGHVFGATKSKGLKDVITGTEAAIYHPSIKFTEEELAIVEVVKHHTQLIIQRNTDSAIESLVLQSVRDTDSYGDKVTSSSVFQYLYEIGVFSPWENIQLLNPVDRQVIGSQSVLRYSTSNRGSSSDSKIFDVEVTPDAMIGLRRDFGNMPVYCVDGEGAEEIDDGFSVEQLPGSNECWIHVHIANPTAVLPPSSVLAGRAREHAETIYMTTYSRPMLPESFTSFTGLVANSTGFCRAMTFSAKIDQSTGTILETDIAPSIVRNIRALTYDSLDASMGWKPSFEEVGLPKKYIPLLKNDVPRHAVDLSSEEREQLDFAHKVHTMLRRQRMENGSLISSFSLFKLGVTSVPVIDPATIDRTLPLYYKPELYPKINLEFSLLSSTYVVSEFMILASRICAMYCSKRGIAVPYRTQRFLGPDSAEPSRRSSSDHTSELFRRADLYSDLPASTTEYSVVPGPHYELGALEGYVRVTSPLRRYLDMIAHWQLEAFFRKEELPFDEAAVAKLAKSYSLTASDIKHASKYAENKWRIQYIQELARRNQLRLTCMTIADVQYPDPVRALCLDFSSVVRVQFGPTNNVKPGTFIVCTEVESIDVITQTITLKAPDPLTEQNTFLDA